MISGLLAFLLLLWFFFSSTIVDSRSSSGEQVVVAETSTVEDFAGVDTAPTEPFWLHKGPVTVTMQYGGEGPVVVALVSQTTGDRLTFLDRDFGHFGETVAFGVPKDGLYVIEVTTVGPWSIHVNQQ